MNIDIWFKEKGLWELDWSRKPGTDPKHPTHLHVAESEDSVHGQMLLRCACGYAIYASHAMYRVEPGVVRSRCQVAQKDFDKRVKRRARERGKQKKPDREESDEARVKRAAGIMARGAIRAVLVGKGAP